MPRRLGGPVGPRIRVYPYKQGSSSAKALAEALGGKVLKLEGSKYVSRPEDTIINWGSSNCPFVGALNSASATAGASNKLTAFNAMRETVSIPQFWTRVEEIPADAYPVVCRTVLSGHSGAGIVIADDASQLVPAPLYVKYVKKADEYRVHIGRKYFAEDNEEPQYTYEVIAVQRKAKRNDAEIVNWQVRNHANGFVFARNNLQVPDEVIEQGKLALASLGLDFGGVDIIWNNNQQRAYVLEVNTACGLEGQTVEDYAAFFRNFL